MSGYYELLLTVLLIKLCHPKSQQAVYHSPSKRMTAKLLGRLDLMECAILDPSEYDKRAAQGLCPPQPTKLMKNFRSRLKTLYGEKPFWRLQKQKEKKKEWTMKKRLILKAVFLGKQSFHHLRLSAVNLDFELIEGLFLILECPMDKKLKKAKKQDVDWYLDGLPIVTNSRLSWRVKTTPLKYLQTKHLMIELQNIHRYQIWPLIVSRDDGRYECFIGGKPQGSEGLWRGITNYFITMMLTIPFVTFAIFYRLLHPERETIVLDNSVVDFYEKILDLRTKEIKTNVSITVSQDKPSTKQEESHSNHLSETSLNRKPVRTNHDTILAIINAAEINQRKNNEQTKQKEKYGLFSI
ncbi:unnamed protein product [Thelazia callipaeda]|uniref:Ig-like domain-containing protein n=1 Tax=Thelazia callipaeda TaxID=103827 RepID=A0A0N5CN71_THECL|nr:unnamed protein product [Thelazia callipaeda]